MSNEEIYELSLTWKEVLKQFYKGKCPIKNWPDYEFMWKCKPVKDLNDKFVYKFIKTSYPMKQDLKSFSEHFKKNQNKYAICFYNKSKSTKLIVPTPQKGKNFSNLHSFLNQAIKMQQKALWKKIAIEFITLKNKNNTLYLSTHGHGVNYLHLRIKDSPDYGYPTKF